jgi:F-type H+-transporting ATPase subunit b
MRIRRLLATALLATGMVVTMPAVAHASGGGSGEIAECLVKAAEAYEENGDAGAFDEAAKECYSAPSPILPAIGEIFWGGLAFAIVAFGLMKFGFPALRKGLADREAKIREDLEAAEAAKTSALQADGQHEEIVAAARNEAGAIVDEARKSADQVRADLIARAEADAAEIRARANADAALATERAMADLQSQVAELSVDLAERVVQRNLDRDTQKALVESFINEVGGSRA